MTHHTPTNTDKLQVENERLRSIIKRMNDGSERWYKSLFNEGTQALAVCETFSDFPATIIDCNAEFRNLLKRTNEQIIDKDFMELMRKGEKRKFFVQAFGNSKEKDIKELPLVFLDGHGNEITIEISTKLFKSSRGRLALVSIQTENHHKSILRNGIEQLLSKSNQIFFGIKEDEILQFDYVSFSVFKVTGYSSEQLLLNPFLFWNNCHPEDLLVLKKAINSDKPFEVNLSIRFIRQDGQMIWLDFSVITSPGKDNSEANYYAVAKETTATQKKERQLKKKESYDQLLLQSAKSLIGELNTEKLKNLANYIGSQLPGDRFSIFIQEEGVKNFSHDVFAEYITTDTKTYAASNETIWNEFKDEFINYPVLIYQSDDDNFNFKQRHISFFNRIKVKSSLIIPLTYNGNIMGFVGNATLIKHYRWDRTDINYISQLSQLLSQAFQHSNLYAL